MENASKALLIAGAILIAILLIGIGMLVMNSTGAITGKMEQQMSAMEIQMFNQQFQQYEGNNKSGANLKALVNAVNANNTSYADDESMQITVSGAGLSSSTWSKTAPVKVTGTIGSNSRYDIDVEENSAGFVYKITVTKK